MDSRFFHRFVALVTGAFLLLRFIVVVAVLYTVYLIAQDPGLLGRIVAQVLNGFDQVRQ